MTPDEARERLRVIGESARQVHCTRCGVPQGRPCAGNPLTGRLQRINTALQSAPRRAGLPGDFAEFTRIFAAAYPISACPPEVTGAGKTVLYRAAPEADPWLGRGSYWSHNPAWATAFARGFELGRADPTSNLQAPPARVPYAVYRAEVTLHSRNSFDYDCDATPGRPYAVATVAMIARAWGVPIPAPRRHHAT